MLGWRIGSDDALQLSRSGQMNRSFDHARDVGDNSKMKKHFTTLMVSAGLLLASPVFGQDNYDMGDGGQQGGGTHYDMGGQVQQGGGGDTANHQNQQGGLQRQLDDNQAELARLREQRAADIRRMAEAEAELNRRQRTYRSIPASQPTRRRIYQTRYVGPSKAQFTALEKRVAGLDASIKQVLANQEMILAALDGIKTVVDEVKIMADEGRTAAQNAETAAKNAETAAKAAETKAGEALTSATAAKESADGAKTASWVSVAGVLLSVAGVIALFFFAASRTAVYAVKDFVLDLTQRLEEAGVIPARRAEEPEEPEMPPHTEEPPTT